MALLKHECFLELRPLLALGWVTTREEWKVKHCEPGSVRRCGLKSVTARLCSHYHAGHGRKMNQSTYNVPLSQHIIDT